MASSAITSPIEDPAPWPPPTHRPPPTPTTTTRISSFFARTGIGTTVFFARLSRHHPRSPVRPSHSQSHPPAAGITTFGRLSIFRPQFLHRHIPESLPWVVSPDETTVYLPVLDDIPRLCQSLSLVNIRQLLQRPDTMAQPARARLEDEIPPEVHPPMPRGLQVCPSGDSDHAPPLRAPKRRTNRGHLRRQPSAKAVSRLRDHFSMGKRLGQGQFDTIYLSTHKQAKHPYLDGINLLFISIYLASLDWLEDRDKFFADDSVHRFKLKRWFCLWFLLCTTYPFRWGPKLNEIANFFFTQVSICFTNATLRIWIWPLSYSVLVKTLLLFGEKPRFPPASPKSASLRMFLGKRCKDEDSDFSDSSDDDAYIPTDDDCSVGSDSDTDIGGEQAVRQAVNKLVEAFHEVGVGHLEEVQSEDGMNADNGTVEAPSRTDPVRKRKRGRKEREGPPLLWEIWEDEHEKWIDENLEKDADLDGQNDIIPETAEPSSDLIIPLLRYQKEWLAWAFRQEESPTKGGILADEMGMGKTAQAIALVLAKRERCGIDWSAAPGPSTGLARVKATLVICPVVAVSQWVSEIDRFTTKGSTSVLVYHGAKRGSTVDQFDQYDFVITTYSIVEAEFRKFVLPPRKKCRYCGKLLHKEKLLVHLKYFCGPDAIKTTKQAKQMTKKKAWSKKGKGSAEDTVSISDFEDEKTSSGKSPLHSLKWERIILDEAHFIKDRQCSTAKAVLALQSSFKWALSGTPLQNRVGELYSLIRFLQIVPYSYYLCKDCDCRTLDYGASKQCPDCPHSSVRHFCWWNKYVANPIQARGNLDEGRRAMILLKHKVLKSILLRRTKMGRAADLALPPRIVLLRRDALDVREEDYYISLYNESQAQFTTYVEAGTVMNNYAHIFDLLTRLRQAVDHPYLVVYSAATARRSEEEVSTDKIEEICSVCHHPSEDAVVTACEHIICKPCLDFSAALGQVSCPTCSKPLTVDLNTRSSSTPENPKISKVKGFKSTSILNRIRLEEFQTSTKIEALREEIMFMVERDGSAKGIVFSQFTSFLDLINYSLQKCGIGCVQLTGDMSISARDASIKRFTEDPECRIFLVSLKAGGVALNLTVASHVFVMDPWWNPAVERQAQDRIHRIGQYKPIRIVRFVIENTIEERILKLQEKKELVFEGTVGGSAEALGKLTEADLRFLFVT